MKSAFGLIFLQSVVAYASGSENSNERRQQAAPMNFLPPDNDGPVASLNANPVAHNFLLQDDDIGDDDGDGSDDDAIVAVNGNLVASNFLPPQDEAGGSAEDNGEGERL